MLKIEKFTLYSGRNPVLVIDDLELPRGAKTLIVGGNGSGKSLLLQAVHGEYSRYEGVIRLLSENQSDTQRQRITIYIENQNHLLPRETVWKNLTLTLTQPTKRQLAKIEEMIFLADLEDRLNEPAANLSQSGRKFVELIRAVAQFPCMILMDDIDACFDDLNLVKALGICDIALSGGATLLATARQPYTDFEHIFRIHNKQLAAR
jgi:ABC-type nitrate/sulfonate/bicarbonate transport system ATPase subunit